MAETQWQSSPPRGREGNGEADFYKELSNIRSDIARLAESVGGAVQEGVKPVTAEVEAMVARNPMTAVMVAAGVGLVLGLLSSR